MPRGVPNKKYTPEFKNLATETVQKENLGYRETAERFGVRHERAQDWERIYFASEGRQGIDQIPTVHLGVAASAMEKRGIRTERGDLNRSEIAAVKSPYLQAAKVAERGTGEYRAAHPCRLYPGHPVTQGVRGEIAGFPIAL